MNLNPIDGVKKIATAVTTVADKAVDTATQAAGAAVDTATAGARTVVDTATGVKDLVDGAWDAAGDLAGEFGDLAGQTWGHKQLLADLATVVGSDPGKAGEVQNVLGWAKDGAHGVPPTDDPRILTALIKDQKPALGDRLETVYNEVRTHPESLAEFAKTEKWLFEVRENPAKLLTPPTKDPFVLQEVFKALTPEIAGQLPPGLAQYLQGLGQPSTPTAPGAPAGNPQAVQSFLQEAAPLWQRLLTNDGFKEALHQIAGPLKFDLPHR